MLLNSFVDNSFFCWLLAVAVAEFRMKSQIIMNRFCEHVDGELDCAICTCVSFCLHLKQVFYLGRKAI